MKLDIILRTHDGGSIQRSQPVKRKVECSKQELTLTCAYSLSKSIKLCDEKIKIIIHDDHSSKETKLALEEMFSTKVTPFKGKGIQEGAHKHFKLAKKSKAELVYLVEDDFLHVPEAISELIESYYKFLENVEPNMICLHPADDYYNYTHHFGPTMIVPGIKRPWRMHDRTTNTFFTNPVVLRTYWGAFEKLSTQYQIDPTVNEDTTINTIWKYHVPLFTPLVPLAFHLDDHDPLFYKDAIAKLWKENKDECRTT